MGSTTPNYGLATGVQTDELVEPWHHNRVADTLDRALGEMVRRLLPEGVHAGWLIGEEKSVTAGSGLIRACGDKRRAFASGPRRLTVSL